MKNLFKLAACENPAKFICENDKEGETWKEVIDPILNETLHTNSSQIEDLDRLILLLKGDEDKASLELSGTVNSTDKNISPEQLMGSIINLIDSLTMSMERELKKQTVSILSNENQKKIGDMLDRFEGAGYPDLGSKETFLQNNTLPTNAFINVRDEIVKMQPVEIKNKERFIELAKFFSELIASEEGLVDDFIERGKSVFGEEHKKNLVSGD